jgi:hypothetical protein
MKRTYFACLILFLTTAFLLSQSNPVPLNQTARVVAPISASQTDPKAQARILDSYGKLPLSFEANHGQTDGRVKFLSRTSGYTLFLTGDEAVLSLSGKKASAKTKIVGTARTLPSSMAEFKAGGVLRMKLRNANPAAKVTGVDELAGTSNYFIGNDPAKWRTNVPTYAKVKYEGIYSGIDLVYYGNQRQLEYDFIVAPGANPHRIQFDVRGAKRIRRDEHGDLVLRIETGEGEIRWHKPVVYQEEGGKRQEIAARYAIRGTHRVTFELAKYDASRPLYIDPLMYSTYLGGSGGLGNYGGGVAVDGAGNAYVTGNTTSSNFPVTPGAFETTCGNLYCGNAFVTKINASGSALVYSTYLGSGNGGSTGYGITVDNAGDAYVTGSAGINFSVTPSAFQTTCGNPNPSSCENAFITKINPSGSALVYSTYLGGSGSGPYGDWGSVIAVNSAGNAYVTGWTSSTNFPLMNPLQGVFGGGDFDAFVTELNPTGSALVYSTYLGGNNRDCGYGIALDSAGNAYVTGCTFSTNFPVTPGAFQTACGGACPVNSNAFVTEINPSGSALVYSTYLGGSGGDGGYGIAVDSAGNGYVTGYTNSTDFPVTPGAFQTTCGNPSFCENAFITEINPSGSALVYSTYLGGSGTDVGQRIAVDSLNNAYVTGWTSSTNFPLMNPLQGVFGGGQYDAFVTKLNPTGSALVYSTYLGGTAADEGEGVAVDGAGNAYVSGTTSSTNFPVTPGAFQTIYNGCYPPNACYPFTGDAFVTTFDTLTLFPSNLNFGGQPVGFTSSPQVSILTQCR